MGNFSLTNPGLAYDQGQGVDPVTGMPIQLPPIMRYFRNPAQRAQQAARDEMSTVQPARSTIAGPAGAPPQIPLSGEADSTQASTNPDPLSSTPRFVQPTFSSTTTDANGLQVPINPAQTKLGKLVSILSAAARGAAAGWGMGNAAAGADRAREIPLQLAAQRQQLQTGSLENQQRLANLRALPLDIAQRQAAIEQMLEQTRVATEGTHNTVWQADPSNPGGMVQQSYDTFGRPVGSAIPAISPYLLKPKIHPVTYVGEDGMPHPGSQNLITGEVMSQDGSVVPNARVFEGSLVPKSSTTSSSSSTDLMGNTRETNQRITAPVIMPSGAPGSTQGATPTPQGRQPVNMVQRTAGGPLVPAAGAPRAAQPNAARPKAASTTSSILPLAPDVEQRLAAAGLKPQEQQYVRGLLTYQGQMPSPRAKNYAATLATLTSIDPNFNAANYDANKKTLEDYTPGGSVGKQAIAFNTSIAHLDMLDQAATALKSSNYPAVNRVAQFLGVNVGQSPVTTFNNIADAVDGEVSKTFKGTATEGELARVGAHFNSALGPEQIQNNVRSTIGLLNGKMGEMQSAFQRQMGRPINLVSPQAQAAIQRMSGSGAGVVQVTDPRGVIHTFPNQAAADNFKRLAKIQ